MVGDQDEPGDLKYYCSKCAILLVSQGQRIAENDEITRQQEIKKFMDLLHYSQQEYGMLLLSVETKKSDIEKFYQL